jgi:prenyltransferase beta subunit
MQLSQDRLSGAISNGIHFLISLQGPAGGFRMTPQHEPHPVDTCEAVYAMTRSGYDPSSEIVRKAIGFVKEKIVTMSKQPACRDYASFIMMLGSVESECSELGIATDELNSFQVDDAWSLRRGGELSTYDTALTTLALSQLGERFQDRIGRSRSWLEKTQNSDGGWGPGPSEDSHLHATSITLLALMEAKLDEELEGRGKAVEFILNRQNGDGSWPHFTEKLPVYEAERYTYFDSGWSLISLLRAGASHRSGAIQKALNWLLIQQTSSGGWRAREDQAPSIYATGAATLALSYYGEFLKLYEKRT